MCNGSKIVRLGCEKQPKLAQKWPKNSHFSTFFDFLQKLHTIRTKISSHFLHHSMVLCLQFQYVRITGIWVSQKEKDLKIPNISNVKNSKGSSLPEFLGTMGHFSAQFSFVFRIFFKVSKGSSSIFGHFGREWMLENLKVSTL